MKRMACVLALATGTGLSLGVTARSALAQMPAVVANGFQISIASNGAVTDDASVPLEVSFHGGNVESIRLTIDGAQVNSRTLNTRKAQGKIRFEVDPGLLGSGDHDVMIEATDREGHIATATVHLHVASVEASGLARLMSPTKNSTVQGIVPIEIKVDDSVRHPFVSFFVDQDFSLLNFAPFTYNWASTNAANGPHSISIEVMDGETQEIIRRFSVLVNVNNPGGLTSRQSAIRDLNQPDAATAKPVRSLLDAIHSTALIAAPGAHFDASSLDHSLANHARSTMDLPGTPHTGFPRIGLASVGQPVVADPGPTLNVDRFPDGRPDLRPLDALPASIHDVIPHTEMMLHEVNAAVGRPDHVVPSSHYGGGVINRPGSLGLFSNPHELLKLDCGGLDNGATLHTRLRSRRVGNIASMPQLELGGASISMSSNERRPGVVADRPLHRVAQNIPGSPVVVNAHGAFEVAFDNSQIAFDVPPRVEHGLPLAPFRQIFEHTGGTVKWHGQSHVVHAYNATREIEFKVGNRSARVNNHAIKMDANTYIDRGRAIVPLTFVRDALHVSVQYDAATGHMRIESRH